MSAKRIETFEEACKAQKLNPKKCLPDVSVLPEKDRNAVTAFAKMCIINRSLNGDWVADWSNYDQRKYAPWYDVVEDSSKASGFSLSFDGCDCGHGGTSVGVRLFYKDSETCEHAAKTFISLYEDMILVPR